MVDEHAQNRIEGGPRSRWTWPNVFVLSINVDEVVCKQVAPVRRLTFAFEQSARRPRSVTKMVLPASVSLETTATAAVSY